MNPVLHMRMVTPGARRIRSLAGVVALALVGVGCGQDTDQRTVDASASDPPVEDGTDPDGVPAFCAAVEELDRTDGTTDSTVVIAAIDEMRRTAPAEIRDDVNRSLDSLVVSNYPDAADPSMEEMSLEEREAAANRMVAYVEQHCPDSDVG